MRHETSESSYPHGNHAGLIGYTSPDSDITQRLSFAMRRNHLASRFPVGHPDGTHGFQRVPKIGSASIPDTHGHAIPAWIRGAVGGSFTTPDPTDFIEITTPGVLRICGGGGMEAALVLCRHGATVEMRLHVPADRRDPGSDLLCGPILQVSRTHYPWTTPSERLSAHRRLRHRQSVAAMQADPAGNHSDPVFPGPVTSLDITRVREARFALPGLHVAIRQHVNGAMEHVAIPEGQQRAVSSYHEQFTAIWHMTGPGDRHQWQASQAILTAPKRSKFAATWKFQDGLSSAWSRIVGR